MKLFLSKQKQDLFIKTSMWNSIVEVFKEEKNMDISNYLVSINLRGNILIVKTKNPLINSELLNFSDKIKEKFLEKIRNLEIEEKEFEVKFR